jgi:FixJ family two-component response regulator
MTIRRFVALVGMDAEFIARNKARLGAGFDLNVFSDLSACLAQFQAHRPDVIVIDIASAGDEGFVLHRALRDDFDLGDVFQLLVCRAEDVAREGFAPDDFLNSPAEDAALFVKLDSACKRLEDKEAAREQMAYAQSVAFTSMSAMGELGVVMQFLSRSFTCDNVQAVAQLALDSLIQYELEGVAYLIWEGDRFLLGTDGADVPPHIQDLIEQRRTLGRIVEIDSRLIVNYDYVSLLVTNLPVDDPAKLGRIRDNLATLAEGVQSRVTGLLLEHDNQLKQQAIRYAAQEIRDSLKNIHTRQTDDLAHMTELVEQVINDFEQDFLHMGLHVAHENMLIGDLVDLRRRIADIISHPGEVHEKLQVLITALETIAGDLPA